MVFRSISVSISMEISYDLSVRSTECSDETAKSNFMILAKLNLSVKQNIKLGSILRLIQCCSVRGGVFNA